MSRLNRRNSRCQQALEAVVSAMRKGKDAGPTVKRLQECFLSPMGILECNEKVLEDSGLSESEACFLSKVPDLARYALRTKFPANIKLDCFQKASEYLKSLYLGVPIEQFYVLCLDSSYRLIRCKLLQKGTVDETAFYLGHLLQTIVTTQAHAFILSHNHPGGTMHPSKADIQCTLSALEAVYPLAVNMLDHIIVADGEAISIREKRLISLRLWTDQNPANSVLIKWLDSV